jgi:hypothetical protein
VLHNDFGDIKIWLIVFLVKQELASLHLRDFNARGVVKAGAHCEKHCQSRVVLAATCSGKQANPSTLAASK